ncbi:MAG: hypothetical protein FJ319_01830 [SAR202 cluster bacterium]|nr:hypothetical protein [SAR202 cluster bacterium]
MCVVPGILDHYVQNGRFVQRGTSDRHDTLYVNIAARLARTVEGVEVISPGARVTPGSLGFNDRFAVHDPMIVGNYLYSIWTNGLQVFEISDPSRPVLAGSHVTDLSVTDYKLMGGWGVYVLDGPDKAVVSDWNKGLFVFDTTPSSARSSKSTVAP